MKLYSLCLLLAASCATQTRTPEPKSVPIADNGSPIKELRPFFYSFTKGSHKGFLLGSMHNGVDSAEIPRFVTRELDDAGLFVAEANVEDPAISRPPRGDDEKPIFNFLTPKEADEVVEKLHKSFGRSLGDDPREVLGDLTAAEVEPYLFATLASRSNIKAPPISDYSLFIGLDRDFIHRARSRGITVAYLDTPETYLSTYRCTRKSNAYHLKVVRELIAGETRTVMKSLDNANAGFAAFRAGDEKQMEALKINSHTPVQLKCVFTERNSSWASEISRLHRAYSKIFVVVGAGHLVGQGSLIDLLASGGYTIQRIEK